MYMYQEVTAEQLKYRNEQLEKVLYKIKQYSADLKDFSETEKEDLISVREVVVSLQHLIDKAII